MQNFFTSGRVWTGLLPALFVASAAAAQTPATGPARSPAAVGQPVAGTSASISGRVVSDKDATLAGTIVSAVNLTTGTQRSVAADADGTYLLTNLLPGGPYIVQVRRDGFKPLSITNVFLAAGTVTPLALTLTTEAVAVGTRRTDRNALESSVPVDVIEMQEQAQRAPQTDVTQLLNYVVPSFNATRQTNAGGSDFVELGSLRGLGTDQMLVLVNGKRRHTTALLGLLGNRGVGTVGTDLNTLPSNGIERVEILRDGAAAQYGSDAIAGVMNVALKSNNHGGSVLASSGITSYGDGFSSLFSVNKGLKLGSKGFLSVTADADYRDPTTRQYSRNGAISPIFSYNPVTESAKLTANNKTYNDYVQRNGDARTYNYRGVLNASVNATRNLRFYTFGGYNYRKGQSVAPWVLPANQPADIVDIIYPLGYQPTINSRINDASGAVGAVLDLGSYSIDVSHTVGYNQMRYDVGNTLNPTQGANSATSFDAGGYQFTQNVTNVTLNRLFSKAFAGTNVAVGGEYRTDRYEIVAGELNSYSEFDEGKAGATLGSQGFTGFSDRSATLGTRRNVGAFVDVDADVTKKWTVSTALRYENYSDFGSAFIYKATSRYQLKRAIAVRAAFNTGFRAPSLQQVLYRQVTTSGGISSGIFNNQDEVTRAAGIPALNPEKSRSYSAGLVLTPTADFTFTADGYLIDINDRIILTGLLGAGINQDFTDLLTRNQISQAQFFTNGVNTRTQGLDLVARYQRAIGRGVLTVTGAANFTQTTLEQVNVPAAFQAIQNDANPNNNYVDQRELSLLSTASPKNKIMLHIGYELNKFSVLLRNTYFGEVSYYGTNRIADPSQSNDYGRYFLVFNPRTVTDLLVTYTPTKPLALTAGVNNLFNVLPNTVIGAAHNGGSANLPDGRDVYRFAPVQMGFNGTFGYLKLAYNFGL